MLPFLIFNACNLYDNILSVSDWATVAHDASGSYNSDITGSFDSIFFLKHQFNKR